MPIEPRPPPHRQPPVGVPRWLWPPPGARVSSLTICESSPPRGAPRYELLEGERPADLHLRALQWLLDEHPRASLPVSATPFEGRVRLDVATTSLPSGRLGHAYALNGGPLGAPGAEGARGVLWRYLEDALARTSA